MHKLKQCTPFSLTFSSPPPHHLQPELPETKQANREPPPFTCANGGRNRGRSERWSMAEVAAETELCAVEKGRSRSEFMWRRRNQAWSKRRRRIQIWVRAWRRNQAWVETVSGGSDLCLQRLCAEVTGCTDVVRRRRDEGSMATDIIHAAKTPLFFFISLFFFLFFFCFLFLIALFSLGISIFSLSWNLKSPISSDYCNITLHLLAKTQRNEPSAPMVIRLNQIAN